MGRDFWRGLGPGLEGVRVALGVGLIGAGEREVVDMFVVRGGMQMVRLGKRVGSQGGEGSNRVVFVP